VLTVVLTSLLPAAAWPLYRRTLLHAAARGNAAACVPALVSRGVSVSTQDTAAHRWTALHEACAAGHSECAAALIAAGAAVNSTANDGITPAFLAAQCGSAECLELLSQHGADFAATTVLRHTLLHAAAACHRPACVALLLRHTPALCVNALSARGITPLSAALHNEDAQLDWGRYYTEMPTSCDADREQCIQLLLQAGAEVTAAVLNAASKTTAGTYVLCEHVASVRSAAASAKQLLTVHADACSSSSSKPTAATAAASTSSDCATAAAVVTQAVVVQLVHAATGVKASKQYQFELGTLQRLHDSTCGPEQCALLNMLQPPPGWSAPEQQQQQQQQQQRVVELKYDGE
jgi:ankyrin repeat protein